MITSIQKISNLDIYNSIYMKRDDLLPFSFGGNKVRIAQEYINDMIDKGCDCIIGYGSLQSNLCRVISNICSINKIPCHIITSLEENEDESQEFFNSKMVKLCGAKIHYCSKEKVSETVELVINECIYQGLKPYYIYGDKFGHGNEAVPVNAYNKVYSEIIQQSKILGIQFDYIFLATGTGMTQSGLLAGQALHNGNEKIIGISVARESAKEKTIISNYLDVFFKNNNELYIDKNKIYVEDRYLSGGYGKHNEEIVKTVKNMYLNNGIPLDYTYTGKAYWGMCEYLKAHKITNKNILFLHTGGTPLFFDNLE